MFLHEKAVCGSGSSTLDALLLQVIKPLLPDALQQHH